MASCPNINLAEWKALESAVGKFEAYKDYMETNGEIRDSQVVIDKIQLRDAARVEDTARVQDVTREEDMIREDDPNQFSSQPSIAELANKTINDTLQPLSLDSLKRTRAGELADKMSRALGVDYSYVTPEQAKDITKNAQNPWSGQPAFFFGGRVYLLEGRLSTENVFHEFSHPVVRHLSKENTEVFNKLYNEVMATDQGIDILAQVKREYPFLTEVNDFVKEEVIVKALTESGKNKINKIKNKSGFAKAIANIMYAIRQAMRKVFGKEISISKLNENTTVDQLADILSEGGTMIVNTQLVSQEDIVAYNRENFEAISESLDTMNQKDLQDLTNTFYDTISRHLNALYNNGNYNELIDILKDDYLRGDLQEMKSNLGKYQTNIKRATESFLEDVAETKGRSQAMTETLLRLDSVLGKMYEHMQDIQKERSTQEGMNKAYYYNAFIKHYDGLIEQLDKSMRTNRVPNDSPIRQVVSSIKGNLDNTKDIIKELQADGSRDALFDQLEPLQRSVSTRYEEILSNLRKKNAPQERIDKVYKEYHGMTEAEYKRFKDLVADKKEKTLSTNETQELARLTQLSREGLSISKEKIEALLKGEAGDANWFNSYLEGYLYNNDPVVGGLALYTKNKLTEVMVKAQAKYNAFAEELAEPLKAAGFNPSALGRLGERTTFEDTIAYVNPKTGLIEEKKVHTFLNQFKNYRYDAKVFRQAVEDTHEEYQRNNTEETYNAFVKAVEAQKKFLRDYFHQEYTDEFYEKDELLSQDEIGKKAAYMRGELFDRMRMLTQSNKSQLDDISKQDEIDLLWREYAQMHSRTYENGMEKTGEDALIAERLREFREASRDFYEWKIRKGVFENQYFNFLQELKSKGLKEGDREWDAAIANWKKSNTRVAIKDDYYTQRDSILNDIDEILSKLPSSEKQELDQSAVWQEILELTAGIKDQDNQVNGTEMSEGSIAKVKLLQEKLEKIRENTYQRSGLTKKEEGIRNFLYGKLKDKTATAEEKKQLNVLNNKAKNLGLGTTDIARLNKLYQELAAMSSKEATSYYVDQANAILGNIDLSGTKFMKDYKSSNIDKTSANWLLNNEVVQELKALSPEFKEWHERNHLPKEKYNSDTKQMEPVFERLYVWNVTKPSDPSMMESYDIKNELGEVVDTVQGVPNLKFYTREVKSEYKTRSIVGVTKDNQGQWLPKTLEQGAVDGKYINERYNELKNSTDPEQQALFRVLEIMKKYHLQNQEGLSYSNRLGYDVPRYRKESLELLRTVAKSPTASAGKKLTGLTVLMKRVKDFFVTTQDQAEDGMSYNSDFNLVRADMFDNEMTDIPISGLYDIDPDDVTMDVTTSLNRYMLSGERQKQLVEMSPVVRAIQNTVNHEDNAIDDINRVHKQNFVARNITKYLPKKDNVRKAAVNNWVEKHFEGETQKGFGADQAFLNNFANLMFKRASFSFFALNIPSAIKNSLGMKFQEMIEASGGRYVDHVSLQKGNAWSYKAMGELSFTGQLYTRKAKSHDLQLIEVFDPVQDRFQDQFGEGISRTLSKDAAGMSWLYSFRKWVEIQATLQLFGGMMYKKEIMQTMPDGSKKPMAYIKAFETIDGQIQLKKGIDVRYGLKSVNHVVKEGDTVESIAAQYNIPIDEVEQVTGLSSETIASSLEAAEDIEFDRQYDIDDVDLESIEDPDLKTKALDQIAAINNKYDKLLDSRSTIKIDNTEFKFMKNRIQQVNNNMGGAYAKFDQPEAQRYLAFRWISYLRRYFTAMAVNRWGYSGRLGDARPRLNPGAGDFQKGFYIQFMQTIIDTVKSGGSNLQYATKEEKQAALKFMSEVVFLMATTAAMGLFFGWDPEDDERMEKLRALSGSMDTPFSSDADGRSEFSGMGFMELHTLHMLMQVRAENEQFNLLTGGIKPYTSLLDWKSVAASPTLEAYGTIWSDLKGMYTGDEKAYYSRDIGPYDWQKKGQSKFYNHFMKTFGVTGSSIDPALAIKNFQSFYVRSNR